MASSRDGNALDRTTLYREQAAYFGDLLTRIRDPRRRALVEQEHEDWLLLANKLSSARLLKHQFPTPFAADSDSAH
jgi:hypothetical protein